MLATRKKVHRTCACRIFASTDANNDLRLNEFPVYSLRCYILPVNFAYDGVESYFHSDISASASACVYVRTNQFMLMLITFSFKISLGRPIGQPYPKIGAVLILLHMCKIVCGMFTNSHLYCGPLDAGDTLSNQILDYQKRRITKMKLAEL